MSSASATHLDTGLLTTLGERVRDNTLQRITSVLVMVDGKLVYEAYDDENSFSSGNEERMYVTEDWLGSSSISPRHLPPGTAGVPAGIFLFFKHAATFVLLALPCLAAPL